MQILPLQRFLTPVRADLETDSLEMGKEYGTLSRWCLNTRVEPGCPNS